MGGRLSWLQLVGLLKIHDHKTHNTNQPPLCLPQDARLCPHHTPQVNRPGGLVIHRAWSFCTFRRRQDTDAVEPSMRRIVPHLCRPHPVCCLTCAIYTQCTHTTCGSKQRLRLRRAHTHQQHCFTSYTHATLVIRHRHPNRIDTRPTDPSLLRNMGIPALLAASTTEGHHRCGSPLATAVGF